MAELVVFLDACVLYPPLLREILLRLAEAGLFRPAWSPRVLAEWRIAAARDGGLAAETEVAAAIDRMTAAFPGGAVTPDPAVEEAAHLPDPADAHVLAGAVAAGAGVLLTFNMRDFPSRRLSAHGITPRHPDSFVWELLSGAPETAGPILRRIAAESGRTDPESVRRALKRARLPRLAKAWAAWAGAGG